VAAGPDLVNTLPLFIDKESFISDLNLTPNLESRINNIALAAKTAIGRTIALERSCSILCSPYDSQLHAATLDNATCAANALADAMLKATPVGFFNRSQFVSDVIRDALKLNHDAMLQLAMHRRSTADSMITNMLDTTATYFGVMRVANGSTQPSQIEVLAINESEASVIRRVKLSCGIILLWFDHALKSGRQNLAAEITELANSKNAALSHCVSVDPHYQTKLSLSSAMPVSFKLPTEIIPVDPWDSRTPVFVSAASLDRFNRHEAGRVERAEINANTPGRKRAREDSQDKASPAQQSSRYNSPASSHYFGAGREVPRGNNAPRGSLTGSSPSRLFSPVPPVSTHRQPASPFSRNAHHH
jgi:hypothetical protein